MPPTSGMHYKISLLRIRSLVQLTLLLLVFISTNFAAEPTGSPWITLTGPEQGFKSWNTPIGHWKEGSRVLLDLDNSTRLQTSPGKGTLINGALGKEPNLITREHFGDVEVELEFMIAKGSNSGVKFMELYEIQILDSWKVKNPKGNDCGGIYPRAELEPRYRLLDEGVPPRSNAARKPGEWQSLHAVFHAPRFNDKGAKTAHAQLVIAVLNGTVIHEKVTLKTPTGHNWVKPEPRKGPLLLQGDHGPVAFRNIRVRHR
ncbi:MAG: DUF1080 domain-containing protein [Planctomycetes bacterium]|nr:DUF1080 domain-containing protein [Planctomycetota bacterium]